jgi:hypothetical protein
VIIIQECPLGHRAQNFGSRIPTCHPMGRVSSAPICRPEQLTSHLTTEFRRGHVHIASEAQTKQMKCLTMRWVASLRRRAAVRMICAALIVWVVGVFPASAATRSVVLLFDERLELPGLAAIDADLVQTLTSSSTDKIQVYREQMDLSRFGSDTYKMLLRDFPRTKYVDKKIDVAVAIIGPALDFLLRYGDEIFPCTPIVFCGIGRKDCRESAT